MKSKKQQSKQILLLNTLANLFKLSKIEYEEIPNEFKQKYKLGEYDRYFIKKSDFNKLCAVMQKLQAETVETEDNIPNGTYIYFDWFTEKIHDKYGFVVRGTVYKKQIIIGLE